MPDPDCPVLHIVNVIVPSPLSTAVISITQLEKLHDGAANAVHCNINIKITECSMIPPVKSLLSMPIYPLGDLILYLERI